MPCYDGRRDDEARIIQQRLDAVTDLLCKAGRAAYTQTPIPQDVLLWWDDHCKWDAARDEPWK